MKISILISAKGTGPRLDITDVAVGPGEESVERSLLECAASHVAPLPDLKITINEYVPFIFRKKIFLKNYFPCSSLCV